MKILILFLSLTFLVGENFNDEILLTNLKNLDSNETNNLYFNNSISKIFDKKFMIDENVGFTKFTSGQNFIKLTFEIFDNKIINFSQIKQDELQNFLLNLDKFNQHIIKKNPIFIKILENQNEIITEYFYKDKKLFSNSLKP